MRACQCVNVCAQAYGTDPREQAERVFEAIRTGVHYVLAENEYDPGYVRLEASSRVDAMLSGGRPIRPTSPMMSQLVFNPEAPLPEKWLAQKAKEAAAEETEAVKAEAAAGTTTTGPLAEQKRARPRL